MRCAVKYIFGGVQRRGRILAPCAVPESRPKYRATLGISYGTIIHASRACNIELTNIGNDRMLTHMPSADTIRFTWSATPRTTTIR